jgi:glycosyltransferase involved in cell wall biosynthesis
LGSTITCLDKNYSTTRLLTKEKPEIINNTDDKFESVLFLPESEERNSQGGLRTNNYFKKSLDDRPLISIITVVFNGEKNLEKTIQSVISQTYDNVEYIIIDGGSTDATVNIIREYEDKIDYWVSESDKGIYDGMNKGIKTITGDWVCFLNSGDRFYNTVSIDVILKYVHCNVNVIFGRVEVFSDKETNWIYPGNNITYKNITKWLTHSYPNHQGMFFAVNFCKENYYSLNYHVSADSLFKENALTDDRYIFIDNTLSVFNLGGLSNKPIFSNMLLNCKDRYNRTGSKWDFILCIIKIIFKKVIYFIMRDKYYRFISWIKRYD